MKRCPQCDRTYTDDALSFCLEDGTPLVSAAPPSSLGPGATEQYPSSRETVPPPTIAYRPGQAPPPAPPPWTGAPPLPPQKRSVWPWILGGAAVLGFMGIGLFFLVIFLISVANQNSNNNNNRREINTNANFANRNANTNANANSRPLPSSFKDDFSVRNWGTGTSQFGETSYQDNEYHIHAANGGYIVMYGPNNENYETKNATVRVVARNVYGVSMRGGFGLVVHGLRSKENQLEDYGFLLDTGDNPRYRVVEHKGGTETAIVEWTNSSTIRVGTEPNQLEVRIKDKSLEFYVNGQYMTSITDNENYLHGHVGFYSSDIGEVAFSNLEISR